MDCKTRAHKDVNQEANTLLHHSSPSSSSSSPNHEFSFTISLHSVADNTRASSAPHHVPSIAVDLSPADDIFFHGHLLPLHLISHLPPASPRSSTNSIEAFSFPVDHHPIPNQKQRVNGEAEPRARRGSDSKPRKPFSLFGLAKWRKGFEATGEGGRSKAEAKRKNKKQRFDVIKRYAKMVFFRRGSSKENVQFHREPPCSYSGDLTGFSNSSVISKQEMMMGRRGRGGGESYSSAPASMRTSPTNSGLLVAEPNCSTADSTMEELQAAIQAAIAHCKNSIAAEEKRKSHHH